MNIASRRFGAIARYAVRRCSCAHGKTVDCKLLVVGGGTGGCSTAWRFSRKLKKELVLLEPADIHYYQAGFTLVGSGIKKMKQTHSPLSSILPPSITWLKDSAEIFDPANNAVYTKDGNKIVYDFMVVAVGIQNDYDKIPGLRQALEDPNCPVSTIFSKVHCTKTWDTIQKFKGGHAVFTSMGSGKCTGAALKIMYLADDYWKRRNIRNKTNITFNTASSRIFGVPKYAAALVDLTLERDMAINYGKQLVEVTPGGAVFLDCHGQLINVPYNMLHVNPPMSPPCCLTTCPALINEAGYLDVDDYTLQHKRYPNVFGIGDCTSTPNSKTAAAIGPQGRVVHSNLSRVMAGKALNSKYTGYGACPILTCYGKSMLAEFLYDNELAETFPFDQSKESRILYHLNTKLLPYLYWHCLVKGRYNGPDTLRRILHLGRK